MTGQTNKGRLYVQSEPAMQSTAPAAIGVGLAWRLAG